MNSQAFFDEVRKQFGKLKASQVQGFEIILNAAAHLPRSHQAYLLATAWHETARTMQPARETLAKTDESAVNKLERAWKAGKLKWVKTPYWRFDSQGKTWLGRGYVQLTHRDNYQKAAALVGADLLGNPDLAMRADIAAKVLVEGSSIGMFTGKKLSDYLPGDYRGARRVINGLDKADTISSYASAFERALQAAGVSSGIKTPTKPPPAPTARSGGGKAAAQTGAGVALTGVGLWAAMKWAEIEAWFAGWWPF